MKASEELLAMRELLAASGAWTQKSYGREKNGFPAPVAFSSSFCVIGASWRVDISYGAYAYVNAECGGHIEEWNDNPSRTHLEVVEMIERAVVEAKRAEGEM